MCIVDFLVAEIRQPKGNSAPFLIFGCGLTAARCSVWGVAHPRGGLTPPRSPEKLHSPELDITIAFSKGFVSTVNGINVGTI